MGGGCLGYRCLLLRTRDCRGQAHHSAQRPRPRIARTSGLTWALFGEIGRLSLAWARPPPVTCVSRLRGIARARTAQASGHTLAERAAGVSRGEDWGSEGRGVRGRAMAPEPPRSPRPGCEVLAPPDRARLTLSAPLPGGLEEAAVLCCRRAFTVTARLPWRRKSFGWIFWIKTPN